MTHYYGFRDTVSSVRLAEGPGHDVLGVWQRGVKTGELVLTKGTGKSVMRLFVSDAPAFHARYGGEHVGTVVESTPHGDRLRDTDYVVSEHGELFTVEAVWALAGRGRKGGAHGAEK